MGRKKKVIENPATPGKQIVVSVMKHEACLSCVHWKNYVHMLKQGNTSAEADMIFCKGCDATGKLIEIKID